MSVASTLVSMLLLVAGAAASRSLQHDHPKAFFSTGSFDGKIASASRPAGRYAS